MKYIQVRIYGAAARKLRTAARKNGRSSSQEATQIIGNHYGFRELMSVPIPQVDTQFVRQQLKALNAPDHK